MHQKVAVTETTDSMKRGKKSQKTFRDHKRRSERTNFPEKSKQLDVSSGVGGNSEQLTATANGSKESNCTHYPKSLLK